MVSAQNLEEAILKIKEEYCLKKRLLVTEKRDLIAGLLRQAPAVEGAERYVLGSCTVKVVEAVGCVDPCDICDIKAVCGGEFPTPCGEQGVNACFVEAGSESKTKVPGEVPGEEPFD